MHTSLSNKHTNTLLVEMDIVVKHKDICTKFIYTHVIRRCDCADYFVSYGRMECHNCAIHMRLCSLRRRVSSLAPNQNIKLRSTELITSHHTQMDSHTSHRLGSIANSNEQSTILYCPYKFVRIQINLC